MEKIIILSGCEGPEEELVAYLASLFPGCSIEIVRRNALALSSMEDSVDEISGSYASESAEKELETKYH